MTNTVRAEQLRRHSIPGYAIKKNSSRGAKHGPSERQRMHNTAKQMLKKTRQGMHGSHPTILCGETCRQLRHRHQIGTETIRRRAVGILSILQGLTICEFFSWLGPVSVDWTQTSRQPTGW